MFCREQNWNGPLPYSGSGEKILTSQAPASLLPPFPEALPGTPTLSTGEDTLAEYLRPLCASVFLAIEGR